MLMQNVCKMIVYECKPKKKIKRYYFLSCTNFLSILELIEFGIYHYYDFTCSYYIDFH